MPELAFVTTAAVVILAVFAALWEVYERHSLGKSGIERSFILYLLGAVFSGFLGVGLIGSFAIEAACAGSSGAGCVFGVAALLFPFSLAIGIVAFMVVWANHGGPAIKSKDGSTRPNPSINTDAAR